VLPNKSIGQYLDKFQNGHFIVQPAVFKTGLCSFLFLIAGFIVVWLWVQNQALYTEHNTQLNYTTVQWGYQSTLHFFKHVQIGVRFQQFGSFTQYSTVYLKLTQTW